MSRTARSTAPAAVMYRIESVEAAVKATIRQVASPAVRDAMWSAWTEALAIAAADSPDRMPWEKAAEATVITTDAAHLAVVRMLESIADIESRRQVRDVLALEVDYIDTEAGESTGMQKTCESTAGVPTGPGHHSPGTVRTLTSSQLSRSANGKRHARVSGMTGQDSQVPPSVRRRKVRRGC
jgi:hypothetical protein